MYYFGYWTVVSWEASVILWNFKGRGYRQALATEEIKGTELKKLTCRRGAEIPPGLGEHNIPPAFPLWLLGGFFWGGNCLTT